MRDGRPTDASDPLDIVLVAYLTRPPGWAAALAQALGRWSREHGDADGARVELEELRAEVTRLRARTRGEPARIRDAVATAGADLSAQSQDLRKRVRALTGDLRAAERAAAQAVERADAARADLQAAVAGHEAQLRRQRDRLAEAERAAEGARRDVRADRDLDDARLWLLTDTLIEAARGVRRELSLAPTATRPADAVAGAGEGRAGGDAGIRDAAELDRVLALPNVHLLVDGYNVTKTGYGELPLADQRVRLIGTLATLAAQLRIEVTAVFDGATGPPVNPPVPRGVRVLFSAPGEIADDLIRRLVAAEPAGRPLVVATSDQAIVDDVRRAGARAVPSAVLLHRLR